MLVDALAPDQQPPVDAECGLDVADWQSLGVQ
jgi:hypothetical protein